MENLTLQKIFESNLNYLNDVDYLDKDSISHNSFSDLENDYKVLKKLKDLEESL